MKRQFCFSLLASAIWIALVPCQQAIAGDASHDHDVVKFDPEFLSTSDNQSIDLTRFERGSSALPGTYDVEIYINDELSSKQKVTFTEGEDKVVHACITPELLKQINLNYAQLPPDFSNELKKNRQCYSLDKLIPQASVSYDSGMQRLNISLPQAIMSNAARGYVNPELWDKGIPAFLLGYNSNFYTTQSHGQSTDTAYIGINGGLNIAGWYFRHDGNYTWQEKTGSDYYSINNYVQHDISAIGGKIKIGESTSRGQLFDTLPYKGVEVFSEERMLPQSQRGYAPEIRGIARTNAKVSIRQNGHVIYETTVSPGAFLINDLYPSGYGGELGVTVTEADGSIQSFNVPYASVTQLLRPGIHKFDFIVGKLNSTTLSSNPEFYQGTWQQGFTNNLTGYSGFQTSGADYYALQVGAAINTLIGAVSADVTQAHLRNENAEGGSSKGQSYQLSYSKYLYETGSNLTLAAYRYSTSGYYDFLTGMEILDAQKHGDNSTNIWRAKNRFNITLNQRISDDFGQIYITGYSQNYWDRSGSDLQYQMGYNNNWHGVSYNLSAGRVRNIQGELETNWQFNLTMPLGGESTQLAMLNAGFNHDSSGRSGQTIGVSGSAGDEHQYSYGINGTNYNQGVGNSVMFNGNWQAPYSSLSATYGTGKGYQNASLGASGTIITWQNGIVMTPYTGDNFAVVEAKGATGAKVGGYSGIHIDPWGHAAVPYLNPYEMNEISIDPKGTDWDVELENTAEKVAPYDGAVTHIVFKTQSGIPLLIMARDTQGMPIPFGAEVFDEEGNNVGSTGQAGQIYARVSKARGKLTVKLGSAAGKNCHIGYVVPEGLTDGKNKELIRFNSICKG